MKLPKIFIRNRKKRIIEEGNCKIKHVYDKKDIMVASLSMDVNAVIYCLRCGEGDAIGGLMEKNKDKMNKKQLKTVEKYKELSEKKKDEVNKSI